MTFNLAFLTLHAVTGHPECVSFGRAAAWPARRGPPGAPALGPGQVGAASVHGLHYAGRSDAGPRRRAETAGQKPVTAFYLESLYLVRYRERPKQRGGNYDGVTVGTGEASSF